MSKQKLPKWFNGVSYNTGEKVYNPSSKESYILSANELSMYDFLMGAQMLFNMGDFNDESILKDYHKGLDWFKETNPKAYKILFDSQKT